MKSCFKKKIKPGCFVLIFEIQCLQSSFDVLSIKREKAVSISCHVCLCMACGHCKRLGDEDLAIPRLLGCLRSLCLGVSCGLAQVSAHSVL